MPLPQVRKSSNWIFLEKKRRKEKLSDGIQVADCGNDHLIGSIEEADPVSDAQRIDVVGQTAFGKLVGLDVIRSDDRLRHDTPVPVGAVTFLTCSQTTQFHTATLSTFSSLEPSNFLL